MRITSTHEHVCKLQRTACITESRPCVYERLVHVYMSAAAPVCTPTQVPWLLNIAHESVDNSTISTLPRGVDALPGLLLCGAVLSACTPHAGVSLHPV